MMSPAVDGEDPSGARKGGNKYELFMRKRPEEYREGSCTSEEGASPGQVRKGPSRPEARAGEERRTSSNSEALRGLSHRKKIFRVRKELV